MTQPGEINRLKCTHKIKALLTSVTAVIATFTKTFSYIHLIAGKPGGYSAPIVFLYASSYFQNVIETW